MNFLQWFSYQVINLGTNIMCRIDAPDLDRVPRQGPLILISNHTGSLEVPLLFARLQPRKITGWAKIETWNNAFLGWLFTLWGAIPVRRGEADLSALRQALRALEQGYIFGLAPEGTRNRNGKLIRARPGAVMLAEMSNAPLLPVVHWGGEYFSSNLKRLRRTDFHVRVGSPFRLDTHGKKITGDERQVIADEMMLRLTRLLPSEYHGVYSGMEDGKEEYLVDC